MPAGTSSRNPDVPIPFEACDPSGTFVFVSYAHADKALAYSELMLIRSLGIRVWYDEGIEPGSEWPEAIATALKKATAFVVLITPAAVSSRNVRNEINTALAWNKPFYAIHLTQTELPLGLELQMSNVQAVMRWQLDKGSYTRKVSRALGGYAQAGNKSPAAGLATPAVPFTPSPEPSPLPAASALPTHLARILKGHTVDVNAVAFSPDGQLLATASSDCTARVWDPVTGRHLRTLTGHNDPVRGVAFSPDGQLLATASDDSTARVWDPATGKHLNTLTGHTKTVIAVAFSPDGRLAATASGDYTARVWDSAAGKHLNTLTGHTSTVWGLAFSPDGRLLATASFDLTVRLWDVVTGQHLYTLTGHSRTVQGVAFSADGLRLATASWDNTARVWD
jgi:WD40 repeat protein